METKTTPEIIRSGEFILTPGMSDEGLGDITIHEQHGKVFVATVLVKDIPQWVNDCEHSRGLLEAELMSFWLLYTGTLSDSDSLLFWRWRFVDCWRNYQTELTGAPSFTHEANGNLNILPMYPRAMRFAVASHMEGAMIEHLGEEEGTRMAVRMYAQMVAPPDSSQWLTPLGIEATEKLKLVFFEVIELIDNGPLPEEVMH
ncbi:hypothetical protein ACIEGI_06800 [Serratia marcescens]|uniref:hypothetical protein n=1 Tax=Serratia marcescens TaxID=615 RepID=UPI0037D77487